VVTNRSNINSFLKHIEEVSRRLKYFGGAKQYLRLSLWWKCKAYLYKVRHSLKKILKMDYTKLPSMCYITITINDIFVTIKIEL